MWVCQQYNAVAQLQIMGPHEIFGPGPPYLSHRPHLYLKGPVYSSQNEMDRPPRQSHERVGAGADLEIHFKGEFNG